MATILIVDENPMDRRAYITLLSNFGHRLIEANDTAHALELARLELPTWSSQIFLCQTWMDSLWSAACGLSPF